MDKAVKITSVVISILIVAFFAYDYIADTNNRDNMPDVQCWGDSLTVGPGVGDSNYPNQLGKLSGLNVINFGVGGENSFTIAQRQGGIPFYVDSFNIPENTEFVQIDLYDETGEKLGILIQGDNGVKNASIDGINGVIYLSEEDYKFYFRRYIPGEEVFIKKGTRVFTEGMKAKDEDDILVIFSGTNDNISRDNVDSLIENQLKMLDFGENEKFIIIGLTYGNNLDEVNEQLRSTYGTNFVDIKEHLIELSTTDYSEVMDQEDKKRVDLGIVPNIFRIDDVHGNEIYYDELAKLVYEKILELDYLSKRELELLGK